MPRHNKFAVIVAGVAASLSLGVTNVVAETATVPGATVIQVAQVADATALLNLVRDKLGLIGTTVQAATAEQMAAAIAEVTLQNRGLATDIAGIAALARPDLAPEIEQAAIAAAPEVATGTRTVMDKALSAPTDTQLAAVETVTGQPASEVRAAAGQVGQVAPPAGPATDGSPS